MFDSSQAERSRVCKVVIVTNILSPYRVPLFDLISQAEGLGLRVVALAESEANRQWRVVRSQNHFGFEILRGWHGFIWRWELPIHLNWGLGRTVRSYSPDVIITSGYDNPAFWQAFFHAKAHRKPFILYKIGRAHV